MFNSPLLEKKTTILSSRISVFDLDETVHAIAKIAADTDRKQTDYVCVSNVHTVVMGEHDPDLLKATNSAILATADGVPLIWASKVLGGTPIHGRASGPDILQAFFGATKYPNLRHYFFGSSEEVLDKLCGRLKNLGGGQIVGSYSPPFRKYSGLSDPSAEERDECEIINSANPQIVWVGLGAPKQELWMYRMRTYLRAPILIGVGAAFDFISGNVKRAPLWMQHSGLEWLYRFSQQPRRLFWRYARTNPEFVLRVSYEKIFGRSG